MLQQTILAWRDGTSSNRSKQIRRELNLLAEKKLYWDGKLEFLIRHTPCQLSQFGTEPCLRWGFDVGYSMDESDKQWPFSWSYATERHVLFDPLTLQYILYGFWFSRFLIWRYYLLPHLPWVGTSWLLPSLTGNLFAERTLYGLDFESTARVLYNLHQLPFSGKFLYHMSFNYTLCGAQPNKLVFKIYLLSKGHL